VQRLGSGTTSEAARLRFVSRLRLSLAAAIVAAFALPALVPQTAYANGACAGGNYGNPSLFDGYNVYAPSNENLTSYTEGSEGIINLAWAPGGLCTNPPNPWPSAGGADGESEWEMVFSQGGHGWVQAGIEWTLGNAKQFFAQENATGCYAAGCYHTALDPDPVSYGVPYTFVSKWYSGCQCEISTVNGNYLSNSSFNPFGSWVFPFNNAWDGETYNTNSDINGTAATPTHFTDMQVQLYFGDSWTPELPANATAQNDAPWTWNQSSLGICTDTPGSQPTPCFNIWTR